MEFKHEPVLLDEVIDGLQIKEDGVYVDATLGAAGHSKEILKILKKGLLIGIDQDYEALIKAKSELEKIGKNYKIFHANYRELTMILEQEKIEAVSGILLDIGVSSYQFDNPERGFSYRYDATLDMRMNKNSDLSAYDVVNKYPQDKLYQIIKEYGEERWAKRISEFIVEERKNYPIETTFELVDVIKKAIPKDARREGPHPAKRTFQAIRIEVNNELEVLRESIAQFVRLLEPGGRLAIITFHSLEDRIVKETFKYLKLDCICPKEVPVCMCDKKSEIDIITRKPIVPTREEIIRNFRSHSAKLRIAEKK